MSSNVTTYYGPSCDNKNKLSCSTMPLCEPTGMTTIQELSQGGGGLVQNTYCFSSKQDCETIKNYLECKNNILNVKSSMT